MWGQHSFQVNRVTWDGTFLEQIMDGAETGLDFVDLASSKQLGAGDLAIMAERNQYVNDSAFTKADVKIWSSDDLLNAYA